MVELQKVQMTEEELAEKKLHLQYCKNSKIESDINLTEMEAMLDSKIASSLLKDDIAKMGEDIEKKSVKDPYGNDMDATDADVKRMEIMKNKMQATLDADLPESQLRLKIAQLIDAKKRIDAPERQIKKLEKEIREKAYYTTASKENPMTN